jgi:hypothetical protein
MLAWVGMSTHQSIDFVAWADRKGLTRDQRALAWEAWQEGQESIRRYIRATGDRPPR